MILKRMSAALRARDWTAVAIEFVIVVLGIFVALQADNWNQRRLNRQLEQVYLVRLADETRHNLNILNQFEQIFEAKIQFILNLPEMDLEETFQKDPQAFMNEVDYSSWIGIGDLRSETYQELESSGRLSLLRDSNLRNAIASNLNDFNSTRLVFNEQIGEYRRILFETLPGRSYYDFRVGAGTTDELAVVTAMDAFRNDPRFEAAANAEVTYGADTLFWIRDFKRRTEEILSLLDADQ
jgi:hypothetical protein